MGIVLLKVPKTNFLEVSFKAYKNARPRLWCQAPQKDKFHTMWTVIL
jgi:hypothetical protein